RKKEKRDVLSWIKEKIAEVFIVSEVRVKEESEGGEKGERLRRGKMRVEKGEGEMCEGWGVICKDVGGNAKYRRL
ncbi:hypothetical protein, partial [Bacillus velezensis]|uniref:hypothetical protein n=1 Tax=Bacillus velezensis TaxID=492670 RepID=UPI001C92DD69